MDIVLPLALILGLFAVFLWLIDTPRRNEERQFGKVKLWINEKGYDVPPRIGPGWNLAILIFLVSNAQINSINGTISTAQSHAKAHVIDVISF